MPTVYKRFVEKEPHQWRQIYKALTLLEYLVKNGAERVVDDSRSRIRTISALRSFHYIDNSGKDQGINIRNRSKELVNLLNDTDAIKFERAKAKHNRKKYQGHSSTVMTSGGGYEGGGGGSNGFGSRYGGFGSDSIPGTGSSSSRSNVNFRDASGSNASLRAAEARRADHLSRNGGYKSGTEATTANTVPEKPKQPEVSLLDLDDDGFGAPSSTTAANKGNTGKEDDFGDFQTTDAGEGGDDDDFGGFEQASGSSNPDPFGPSPVSSSSATLSSNGLGGLESLQSSVPASSGTFDPFGSPAPSKVQGSGGALGATASPSAAIGGMGSLTSDLQSLSMNSSPAMNSPIPTMSPTTFSMSPLNPSSSSASSTLGSSKPSNTTATTASSKGTGGLSSLDDLWASTKAGSFDIMSSKPSSSSTSSAKPSREASADLSENHLTNKVGNTSPSPMNPNSGASSKSMPAAPSSPTQDQWGSLI